MKQRIRQLIGLDPLLTISCHVDCSDIDGYTALGRKNTGARDYVNDGPCFEGDVTGQGHLKTTSDECNSEVGCIGFSMYAPNSDALTDGGQGLYTRGCTRYGSVSDIHWTDDPTQSCYYQKTFPGEKNSIDIIVYMHDTYYSTRS